MSSCQFWLLTQWYVLTTMRFVFFYFSSFVNWKAKLTIQRWPVTWSLPAWRARPGKAWQWDDTTFWQWPFISDLTKRQWHVCMIYQNLSNKHAIEGTWTYHEVVFSLNFSWPHPVPVSAATFLFKQSVCFQTQMPATWTYLTIHTKLCFPSHFLDQMSCLDQAPPSAG